MFLSSSIYHDAVITFILLASFKYIRLLVNCFAYLTYRPIPLPDDPQYTPRDVTAIIPSLAGDGEELKDTILSCLRNDISTIIVVTVHSNLHKAQRIAKLLSPKIKVLSIEHPNKRNQLCEAIPYVQTKITILADDDVLWPSTLLPWMLAPFEDSKVGGVGTSQRLKREERPNFWNFLGAAYLLRRNWDIVSCNKMDSCLPCLSGRTVAYRTEIIRDPEFMSSFMNEKWGNYILKADDDNFLTRWLLERGWQIRIQKHKACEVETTLEGNSKYMAQCLRWARSNWRSNLRSLQEGTIWRKHPWSTYAVFQTTITSWSLFYDLWLGYLWWNVTSQFSSENVKLGARVAGYLWIFLLNRLVKYCEHFARYPQDLIYVPLIPLFGYFHSIFVKAHALFTLRVTAWGSREGADTTGSGRMLRLAVPEHKTRFYSTSVDFSKIDPSVLTEKNVFCADTVPLLAPT